MARRLPGLLPALAEEARFEVRQIAELVDGISSLKGERPFRSPHHGITVAGLVGGGSPIRPGEISRAHRGVLFLDELPEISLAALEALQGTPRRRSCHPFQGGGKHGFSGTVFVGRSDEPLSLWAG